MNKPTHYDLTLTTITPVHIGSGDELRKGFDFITEGNYTYRLDVDQLIEVKADQMLPDAQGRYPLPETLITAEDKRSKAFYRYRLTGKPSSTKRDARLKEALKDVHDRPYIPGSSLKGAIRTALAWAVWDEVKPKQTGSKSQAADFEKLIFGKDPNHDLLKALQVSDCLTKKSASKSMRVANVNVVGKGGGKNIPIEMEVIRADQEFKGSLTIDTYLFDHDQASRELSFNSKRDWFEHLCRHLNAYSFDRVRRLLTWFGNTPGCEAILQDLHMINNALKEGLPENQAVLTLGFGGGWDGMTFGSRIQEDPVLWGKIVSKLPGKKINKNKPFDFPTTRRVMLHPDTKVNEKLLGWVVIDLLKRE